MGLALLKFDQIEPEEEQRLHSQENQLQLYPKPPVLWQGVADESLPARLMRNLRDAFFSKDLPPLELTSQPVAVADPLRVRRGPASSILSFILHAGLIALVIWAVLHAPTHIVVPKQAIVTPITLPPYIPITPPAPKVMSGGGGGGAKQIVEASKGHLPKIAKQSVVPPQLLRIDHPKLAVEPTVVVPKQIDIPNNSMPNMGVPQSPQVAVVSQGTGTGSGFGGGGGGGIGFGQGNGVGQGSGGGYGGIRESSRSG
jgi:periplasmic protein TonB